MNIALTIASMGLGGAQQVLAWLAGRLAEAGHHVSVLTLDNPDAPAFTPLSPAVRLIPLSLAAPSPDLRQALAANFGRLRRLRKAILALHPDVVLSFQDQMNVLTLLALAGRTPVVVSERIHPALHPIGATWSLLRRLTYPRARAVVVQTSDIASFFSPCVRRRCVVLPNPVLPPPPGNGPAQTPTLVGLGRLHRQKGFDLLLKAFALARREHPGWRLRIHGEGEERDALSKLCIELGLDVGDTLPGATREPYARLREAWAFALPSRYEGFPNALAQAMSCGLPVVATHCPGATAELVQHTESGLLVPPDDVVALAEALARLMADEVLRQRLGRGALGVLERFAPDGIYRRWEALLTQAAHGKSPCAA